MDLKNSRFLTLIAAIFAFSCASTPARAVDPQEVEKLLTTSGAEGWIHGAAQPQGLFVFTYRNPTNFFDYLEMSLVATDTDMMRQLQTVGRHDKVRVKGSFLENPSPQKHIKVSSIEILKKYQSSYETEPYSYSVKIPDDILHIDHATFLIHAVAGEGHILVVEYRDVILPIFVKNADLAKGLYRNDVVQLKFKIREEPESPSHLELDEKAADPVHLVDSIHAKNGKPAQVEGALILFPQSPEILFNVFAVQELLPDGLNRQYTLVNFDDPALFKQIRDALQKAWDKYPGPVGYRNGRNKLVSTKIRVKATGTFNEVDPGQANPQILLKSLADLQIIEN
jgi:hypothetical protein